MWMLLSCLCSLLLASSVWLVLSSAYSFLQHLHQARQTGLPYITVPVFELNPIWQLTKRYHRFLISNLPFGLSQSQWLELWYMDWRFVAKHKMHKRIGDIFFVVAPGKLMLEIGDASIAADVIDRSRKDFVKPTWLYTPVNIFGLNIITAEGHTWRRHRKVVAPQYNDAIHARVWHEAASLAKGLIHDWTAKQSDTCFHVDDASPDLTSLALRVIAAAGFGMPIPFRKSSEQQPQICHDLNRAESLDPKQVSEFPGALEYMITNFMKLLIIPPSLQQIGPSSWRKLHRSFNLVDNLLKDILQIQVEKQSSSVAKNWSPSQRSILSELVLSGGLTGSHKSSSNSADVPSLTQDEVLGNTFVLALAGSRTTADSLLFSFVLLALHEDAQDWLYNDVQRALEKQDADPLNWDYHTVFPTLVAPLCIMMETLRLYPSAVAIPKWTGRKSQQITVNGAQILLPPRTMVTLSLNGLHYNPRYWGSEPAAWRPQNWDVREDCAWSVDTSLLDSRKVNMSDPTTISTTPYKSIRTPVEGSYLPFSDGARGCLGKRFSQVEFAMVMAYIIRDYRVEIALEETETLEQGKTRVENILQDCVSYLTLGMQQKVPLNFFKRQSLSKTS